MTAFSDRLFEAVQTKESHVVVGIDPDPALMPAEFFPKSVDGPSVREAAAKAVVKFSIAIVHAVADAAVAVKPQLAYFERLGPPGLAAYETVVREAQDAGLLVIADGKRNDIGSTAEQYAAAFLGSKSPAFDAESELGWLARIDADGPKADALTVSPYLGSDGIAPFLDRLSIGKGVFLLAKTSNPSSRELQDLLVFGEAADADSAKSSTIYSLVGGWAERWNQSATGHFGYGGVGVVVGATHPRELRWLRRALPSVPFLVPGFGAQGATASDVADAFDERGLGAVVNASRSVLYAYRNEPGGSFEAAARKAALRMRDQLLKEAPIL